MFLLLLVTLISFILFLGLLKLLKTTPVDMKNKYVLITGGSSGIGKSLAVECARRGAHVTIVARNQQKLDSAFEEIMKATVSSNQIIQTLSLDISRDYDEIKSKFETSETKTGTSIYMLINCAGSAICGTLEQLTPQQIKSQLDLNTLGSILPTKAVIEGMKSRKEGYIVFVASQAAYCGIYGLSAYSASKFALRGFAEALNMETQVHNVKVCVSYPPDTDTPGYQEEEKTKPQETKLISEASGLFQPQQVACKILDDSLSGKFSSNIGLDGYILENLCSGMSPMQSFSDLILQVCSLGILRVIAVCYNFYFGWIINKCYAEKTKAKIQQDKSE